MVHSSKIRFLCLIQQKHFSICQSFGIRNNYIGSVKREKLSFFIYCFYFQDQSRVMIIFETPQSSRASMKITLERNQNGLADVDLDEMKLLNPYCLLVTIPSKKDDFLANLCTKIFYFEISFFTL